ncbi:PEP-CTERM sorting domain-containing protein [Aquincola sp. MAHUQ-54]|uniref:PEP-CTERM sorting domain-containing protein n=1 Tax=Aquincola agrisoli TaxID=3119538 RepID=A0AAW9QDW8_9BURK
MSKLAVPKWLVSTLVLAPALASALTIDFETRESRLDDGHYAPIPGVSFSNAIVFVDEDADDRRPDIGNGTGNFGRAPNTPYGAMMLYKPATSTVGAVVSFEPGFVDEISFWYSTINTGATVTVLDASNNVLAQSGSGTAALELLGSDDAPFKGAFSDQEYGRYNKWAFYRLSFAGIGHSIVFNGTVLNPAPDGMALGDFFIDDLTLTSAVPETSTVALMIAGLAGLGLRARRRT